MKQFLTKLWRMLTDKCSFCGGDVWYWNDKKSFCEDCKEQQ